MSICTVGVAMAALAGCSVVQPFQKPVVNIPTQWMTSAPSGPGAATTPTDPARRFWTEFGSAQLQSLLAVGVRDGLDVSMARARLAQAEGSARITAATGAPTLSVGLDATRGNQGTKASNKLALQAGLTVDPWDGLAAQADAARASAAAAGLDVVTVQRTLLSQIATQYFTVLACDERISLAQTMADDAERLLALVERQAGLGAASTLDVVQQRNAVQTLQAAIPALRQQRVAAQAQLAVLVSVPPVLLKLNPEALMDLRVPRVDAVAPADVIDARPDVLAAEARLRAAHLDVGAARAAFLPSLSLSASAGWLLSPTAAAWSAAASVLQPLLDGGQREGQLAVDQAKAREMLDSYRLTILQALQQTENQLAAVDQLQQQERLDEGAVASAADALRLSRIRYERGASDLLAVLLSQKALSQARDALVQVRLQRLQAAADLYIATGGRSLSEPTPAPRPVPQVGATSPTPSSTQGTSA